MLVYSFKSFLSVFLQHFQFHLIRVFNSSCPSLIFYSSHSVLSRWSVSWTGGRKYEIALRFPFSFYIHLTPASSVKALLPYECMI